MLELDHGKKLIDDLWEATAAQVQLADSVCERFMAQQGPMPLYYDNKRSYHRYYLRGKAVLKRGKTMLGTFTKDISRQGVGFLSPVQLLPKEHVILRLPTAEISVEVSRCRRIDQGCFDCGARFALKPNMADSTH